jgi:hypothetical protein
MAVSKPKVTKQPKGNVKKKRLPSASKPYVVTVEQTAPVTDIIDPVPVVEPIIEPVAVDDPVEVMTIEPIKSRTDNRMVIGLVGGSIVGIIAYKGLKTVFINKGMDQDKAFRYAVLSGVACALIVFGVLYNVTKKTA